MNKIIKTILIGSVVIFGAGFLFADFALAQPPPLDVEFETTPLFNEINFLPDDAVTRWVKVTNNSGQTQRIATEAINYSNPVPTNDLSRALTIVIKEGATDLYGGSSPTGPKTLFDFYQDSESYSEISLSDLVNGATTRYDFRISFPHEKENEWQNTTTTFDILIGFQQGTSPLPPSPPAPPSGGGSLPSGLTIQDESVRVTDIGETSVTIIWTTSYLSTSQVIYGTGAEVHTLVLSDNTGTPPKYGYAHTTPEYNTNPKVTAHVVTITGLNPATTYYFRAVSHASLAISQQFSFTTSEFTEERIGEIKGEEPIFPQPEEATVEGEEQELVGKPSEEFSGGLEKELTGEKGTGELPMEEKRAWWEGLINEGLLAAIGLKPLNFKLILFIVLIIFIVLLISKLIIRRKREEKNKV